MSFSGINWRDTYRPARLFFLDARLGFALIVMLLHFVWWTVLSVIIVSGLLFYFEKRKDMSVPSALRWARSYITTAVGGALRPSRSDVKMRRLVDFDRRGSISTNVYKSTKIVGRKKT
jgi:intracellular multiplication protein IcmT